MRFERVTNYNPILPIRATANSAGYDFFALETFTVYPNNKPLIVPTGVKAFMFDRVYLQLVVRSSLGKKGLILSNCIGVIDADYYNNPDNEGHISGMFINLSDTPITINKGERFMQGIFLSFFTTENDNIQTLREGGFGSTNK